jgi:peptidoglycan/xylan/chitin deacetylase (PgdA/CDA1 family)
MKNGDRERGTDPHRHLLASDRLALLDEYRVPYHTTGNPAPGSWHSLSTGESGRAVHWHRASSDAPAAFSIWGTPAWGHVAMEEEVARYVATLGPGTWRPDVPVLDAEGVRLSSLWRSEEGGTILPFDPDEVLLNYRSERYRSSGGERGPSLLGLARRAYYAARPLVPRGVQLAARRAFTRVQARQAFPRWPAETALHDLSERILQHVAAIVDGPLPYIASWPKGYTWSFVLTHDVEWAAGRDGIGDVLEIEANAGVRSSWNFVPERYTVPEELLSRLRSAGCEVGLHGLRHDGKDLGSLELFRERLPAMQAWARRWGATGFRAPATHRVWEWMPELGLSYDLSYPDTDPYEPIPGGCCTWLPFFNGQLLELPLTLAQDHTLFEILRTGPGPWYRKAELLRDRGGMALLDTHPDYMLDAERQGVYRDFIETFAREPGVWVALPCEVDAWWRRRAGTDLRWEDGAWALQGPAAEEAAVAFITDGGAQPGEGRAGDATAPSVSA